MNVCAPPPLVRSQKPTMVSLFSGAGGLDIGLENAGFDTLLANEIEPHACETLKANRVLRGLSRNQFGAWFEAQVLSQRCFKRIQYQEIVDLQRRLTKATGGRSIYLQHATIVERDIRELSAEAVLALTKLSRGDLDLIAGGPPCQPFSRAGKREMTSSREGQLFLEYVRLVEGVRPRWVLFENVKGLVIQKSDVCRSVCSHCGTKSLPDFVGREALSDTSEALLYCAKCQAIVVHHIAWAKERAGALEVIEEEFRRIGYRVTSKVLNAADFGAPQHRERLFIIASRDGEDFSWPQPTHGDAPNIQNQPPNLFNFDEIKKPHRTLYDALYRNGHWKYGELDLQRSVLWVKNVVRPHDEPVTWSLKRISPTIGAHQAAKLAIAPYGVPEEQLRRQQWHVLGRRQGDTPPVFVEHEYLQDRELMELQTFPESWYFHGTRMERAFQIGNAVPPILAEAVGRMLFRKVAGQSSTSPPEDQYGNHTSSLYA